MELKEISLTLNGNINYKIFKYYSTESSYNSLIIKFIGSHGYGSGGNLNSLFMKTIISASVGIELFNQFILDLGDFQYEFGDSLFDVLNFPFKKGNPDYEYKIIISDSCEKGIISLIEFEGYQNRFNFKYNLEEVL
ncbi:MAG: hypothetical protein KDK36_00050 [Leptospiraceae bacterium]|nr:hypothetical protein [Leptospiraceae bacterium]